MRCTQWCYFIVILCAYECVTENILIVIESPFYSHQMAFRPLWKELADKGHTITLLTANPMEQHKNISQVDLAYTYRIIEKYDMYNKLAAGENVFKMIMINLNSFMELEEYILKRIQTILRNGTKFDLVISEFHSGLGAGLSERLGVPLVGVVSMDGHFLSHDSVGNPCHPVAYPDYDLPFEVPLNFVERVHSVLYSVAMRAFFKFVLLPMQHKMITEYIGDVSPLEESLKNVSLLLINANTIFYDVRPVGPKTINIGGAFHFSETRPLPQDLQKFLDDAHQGFIYISFGTNIRRSHIANKTIKVILDTFAQLPYQILWKFDEINLSGLSSNVKIERWIPQHDVFKHKNIKLLITQGGLHSMEEAILSHIPMIGLPFFGDQHHNVKKMVAKEFGLAFDHASLEVESFKTAILDVINDPRYKEKTKELADLVLDQPMTGLEKAVWWIEYVIRHGHTEHFRNPIVDLPLISILPTRCYFFSTFNNMHCFIPHI
ncbi:hypothetical protein NQ318_013310 [Aromia moschata]|uniref:UDP-glucuronosyltransferase n=1 Tax=Aromia moschata TaxID=1265417 RepID=A0AAV8XYK7_9CUCU|nr:hypothetical protein NQ318_013310 [Aromia moschata]